jgi:TolA-binding protein
LVESAINQANTPRKGRVEQLEGRLRELRAKREGLDGRLQELVVAVQRQERLNRTKQESAQRHEE